MMGMREIKRLLCENKIATNDIKIDLLPPAPLLPLLRLRSRACSLFKD